MRSVSDIETVKEMDFCPHCGARVLITQPALLATEMGFMSRVKQVDLVLIVLTENSLCIWSASQNGWTLSLEAREIMRAKFIASHQVNAKLPKLPPEAQKVVGSAPEIFEDMLKVTHWSYGIGNYLKESSWPGVQIKLHDGREFFFAIERTPGFFWNTPAWKLSKAISTMTKMVQAEAS
jgi:hypothetical protein